MWRRHGAHVNWLFHFVLSLSTDITNRRYCYSKTLNISVVCIGLFISTHGAYQKLVWLVIACSWYGVLKLVAYKYWGLRRKKEGDIWFIQRFSERRRDIIWEKVLSIEADTVWNRVIPSKILKITHNYLIFLFMIIFWLTFTSFKVPQSLLL